MSAYGYTASFGFVLINYQTQGWHTEEYNNWRKLDNILNTISDAGPPFTTATGSGGNYILTYSPPVEAYTEGMVIAFAANHDLAGPGTVNVNGLGNKDLYRDGAQMTTGIVTDDYVRAQYDGEKFLVIQPASAVDIEIADGSITPDKLSTGHPIWDTSGNQTVNGSVSALGAIFTGGASVISHNNGTYNSGKVYFATTDPTGGNNGDIWFKYTA